MGVYNPLAKMPHGCGDCDFYDGCYCPYLDEAYVGEFQKKNEKHPDCPLVEVKAPHGRLIDANALKNEWNYDKRDSSFERSWVATVRRSINHAPTVIEAEGKEDVD